MRMINGLFEMPTFFSCMVVGFICLLLSSCLLVRLYDIRVVLVYV